MPATMTLYILTLFLSFIQTIGSASQIIMQPAMNSPPSFFLRFSTVEPLPLLEREPPLDLPLSSMGLGKDLTDSSLKSATFSSWRLWSEASSKDSEDIYVSCRDSIELKPTRAQAAITERAPMAFNFLLVVGLLLPNLWKSSSVSTFSKLILTWLR